MYNRIPDWLPGWAHPRFPLVANELRKLSIFDYRIAATSHRLVRLFSILNPILLIISFILLISHEVTVGFMVYIPLLFIAPLLMLLSESFYLRLLTNARWMAAHAIAGEVEHGTWDIIRTVPLPRYQLIFSKFAALLWTAQPTLLQIFVSRLVIALFIGLLRYNLNNVTLTLADALPLALLGLMIVLMPLLELFVTMSGGLLISATTPNIRQANLWMLIMQGLFRMLTGLLFFVLHYDAADFSLIRFFPLLIFPHWELMLLWMWLPVPLSKADQLNYFATPLILAYVLLPLIVGGLSLWSAIRRVQNT
ncbi:MAG: hypothetical protein K8L91_17415 [Anaerolineae bacterium]|nr:hypothetical protein [Anaerolineae bacterium]